MSKNLNYLHVVGNISKYPSILNNILILNEANNSKKVTNIQKKKYKNNFDIFTLEYIDHIQQINNNFHLKINKKSNQLKVIKLKIINSIYHFDFFDISFIISLHFGKSREIKQSVNSLINNKPKQYNFINLKYLWLDSCDLSDKNINRVLNNVTEKYFR